MRNSKINERPNLLKSTRDRNVNSEVAGLFDSSRLRKISAISTADKPERLTRYCYRAFDRQWVLLDARVGDYFRPDLIYSYSSAQVYFCQLQSHPLAHGPGIIAAAHIPDRHIFRGSYSGKDIIPFFRDGECRNVNITYNLLNSLGSHLNIDVEAGTCAAYVYALLANQTYTQRFWNELETPGPRVPVTKDPDLFAEAAALGRRLIWLHTYAERFQGEGRGDEVPAGRAKCLQAVPDDPKRYPETYSYDPTRREIHVGEGRFGPVAPEVWGFEVSGLKVVQSWLGYRMKKRAGKKSSPLDDIRPERWTPQMTDEFLELLWVLEATLAMEPQLADVLDRVVAGPCFTEDELPAPTEAERKPPAGAAQPGDQYSLMDDD